MEILQGFWESIVGLFNTSGLASLPWQNYVMILISLVLIFLAIKKQYEPLLLLPIAFGMLLVNLFPAIMGAPSTDMVLVSDYMAQHGGEAASYATTIIDGQSYYNVPTNGGLLYYLYQGVKLGIYPPLIFLGIGAMTDFGPLIARRRALSSAPLRRLVYSLHSSAPFCLAFLPQKQAQSVLLEVRTARRLFSLRASLRLTYWVQSQSPLIRIWRSCRLSSRLL